MRRRGQFLLLVVVAAVGVARASGAFALERAVAAAQLSLATATVSPVASETATANCPNGKKGDVLVQWAASPSSFVTGYTVTRSVNGAAAATVATLSATARSYDDTTVTGSTTYTYAVVATYRSWTSPAVTATATTAKHC